MIGAITSNSFLAAIFGPGGVRIPPPENSVGRVQRRDTGSAESTTDTVELSPAAKATRGKSPVAGARSGAELESSEQQEIGKLKRRDAEVRRHEAAHKRAAGSFAKGGPKFEFQSGPDGKQYAVGGEVSIDTSKVAGDPQATIRKMQQVRRAALAPANPSSQDRAVAATAARIEQEARTQALEKRDNGSPKSKSSSSPYGNPNPNDENLRGLLVSLFG